MPLAEGAELGPYQIRSLIGQGGMGEVYLARDPRLDRDVAIKVSAARFTERFEREARTVAQLNHPNVCTLYDVGPNFLVMEFVEGETLAERIKSGPIPLDEGLKLANQIIDGIEAAHEKGITHRDLKPANIKIKPDGPIKILDFGLAKVGPEAGQRAAPPSENSPTLTMGLTEAGAILGTAAYMSPEQAKGKTVDKRADIWAFGVVLHEMLTGERLFQGGDMGDTMAAVIMKEPDLSAAPERVRRLLERCLEKDPRRRLRDIGDARMLLEEGGATSPAQATSRPHKQPWLAWIVAALVLVAAVLGFGWWQATRSPALPLVRFDVDLGADVALAQILESGVTLSPDGTRLAYAASVAGGPTRLYIRRLDEPKAVEIPGTDGAGSPFFSPDGQWVGFNVGNPPKLAKVSVEGGAVVPLADLGILASWGEDGSIVYGLPNAEVLFRIPPGGGAPTKIGEANKDGFDFEAQTLPGGGRAVPGVESAG
jgi:serine/threonine-protein kinase